MTITLITLELYGILEAVRGWVTLLSKEEFVEASKALVPLPNRNVDSTAEMIKEALGLYVPAYRDAPLGQRDKLRPTVRFPEEMSGEKLIIYCPGTIGAATIEYDVPIDGRWSDLTARLELIPQGSGFGIALIDLHVL